MTDNRAVRLHAAHDLRLDPVADPAPGPGEVRVAVAAGGICGSDLHYYHDGGFGPIRVREPIVLGHEIAGRIESLGAGVTGLAPGELVAVNPSQPCGHCRFCAEGAENQCLGMRFMGSAMRLPHEQGGFCDRLVVPAARALPLRRVDDPALAACAEPLAVCLHAARLAGELEGRRVLVTGAGPIGVLTTAVARAAGASEVVTTDLQGFALDVARRMGAHHALDVGRDPAALDPWAEDRGRFDTVFECSAAAPAIAQALACLKPRGTLVQVGMAGPTAIPLNLLVGKEITLRGAFRFDREFAEAVEAIATRRIDVRPAITGTWPVERAEEAFAAASDRARAVKVHLTFGEG